MYHYKDHIIDENRKEIQYAKKIISGEYLAEDPEILACKRFLNDLERQNDDDFPYCYDTTRADRFFLFFEKCPNTEDNTILKLTEFQYFDCGNIFGWVRKDNGSRRWRNVLIYEARGQGKSSLCAVISLYVFTADKIYIPYDTQNGFFEPNQYISLMAYDKDQTTEVRKPIIDMVNKSNILAEQVSVGKGDSKSTYIRAKKRGGEIKAISKETKKLDGAKLNLIICDEWAAHLENKRLSTLMGSFGKRKQSMCVKITTAGDDAMIKPAKADYDRCLEVLKGNIKDERYFIVIRELGEKDDPADFSLYEKCTPMLRENNEYSKRLLDEIKDEYNDSFNGGTAQQKIEYLIKRTNRWQVASEEKFFQQEELDKLQKAQIPREEFYKLVQSHNTVVGYDASVEIDLTAQAYVFNLPDNKVGIDVHAFMPEGTLIKHKNTDKLPYEYYNEQGLLTLVDGDIIDDWEVMQYMCDYENKHNLQIVGFSADRAFATQMLIALEMGRTPNGKTYSTIECPQTTAVLNEACLLIKKLNLDGRLVICENELLMKHFANAYAVYDKGGRVKISKKDKSSAFRIDLFAALLNALRKIDLLESENLINAIMSGKYSFLG